MLVNRGCSARTSPRRGPSAPGPRASAALAHATTPGTDEGILGTRSGSLFIGYLERSAGIFLRSCVWSIWDLSS